MEDEILDQPATESEASGATDDLQQQEVDQEQQEGELDENANAVEDESEEVDYEGKKYLLPKELKEALLRQSDYTRKTQEVAEARKSFEAQQQQFQQHLQLQQQTLQDHAHLMTIEQQLEQFNALDWNAVIENDPVQAMKLQQQFNTLQNMRGQVATRIQQVQQEQLVRQQAELAKQIQSGQEALAREIKGWSPELAKSLSAYGTNIGFSENDMASVIDPRQVKVLHKAYLYDQLIAKQAKKPASEPVKPATTVRANSAPAKDPEKMTTEEWVRWRNKQVSNQRRRT